ncbi:Os10g0356850 [Oryza sativa Japonica Group]|uniref:Os10g0356850 protein n=1 Tax=Oryza sativa subsp. japonica TaxID=39947 RepID=C7J7N5_ORYSJ|nr:Os10g0356850 [Oryza sativa Japonica Group]|eukprot:NP_001176104.1 Os10g0356850 [Oryza sativa Japonica Group]
MALFANYVLEPEYLDVT